MTQASAGPPQREQSRLSASRIPFRVPFFYGWLIVGVTVVAASFAGSTSQLFMSIMVKPMSEEMGWTRTQMAGALTLGVIVTASLGPILGRLTDRYGARALMSLSAIVVSLGFFGLAGLRSLWQFYLTYTVGRGVAQAALGGVVASTTMANWFRRRRGRAMGLIGTSFQVSNTIMIPVAQYIMGRTSWRIVFVLLGLGTALLVVGPAALILRRRPEDVGLLPDGARPDDRPRNSSQESRGQAPGEYSFTPREAARAPAFWFLAVSLFLTFLINGSVTFHLVAYFTDVGISVTVAAAAASLFALASGFSSLFLGVLAERMPERILGIAATMTGAVVMTRILVVRSDIMALVLSGVYGLAARGEGSVLNLIIARYYGRGSFGAISGTLVPLGYVGLGLGPLLGSLFFDATGTYTGFWMAVIVCHLLTAFSLFLARQPRPPAPVPAQ